MEYSGTERRSGLSQRARLAIWALIFGAAGGVISSITAFAVINSWSNIHKVTETDAVAVANTYIVYTTFVIAVAAVALTIMGFIFTQQFAVEKEAHLANAFAALCDFVDDGEGKAEELGKQVMGHPDVIRHVEQLLREKVTEELRRRKTIAEAKVANARAEADVLSDLNNNLSGEAEA